MKSKSPTWWEDDLDLVNDVDESEYEGRRVSSASDLLGYHASDNRTFGNDTAGKLNRAASEIVRILNTVLNAEEDGDERVLSVAWARAGDSNTNSPRRDVVFLPPDWVLQNYDNIMGGAKPEVLDALCGKALIGATLKRTMAPKSFKQAGEDYSQNAGLSRMLWEATETAVAKHELLTDWPGFAAYLKRHAARTGADKAAVSQYVDDQIDTAEAAVAAASWNLANAHDQIAVCGRFGDAVREVCAKMGDCRKAQRYEHAVSQVEWLVEFFKQPPPPPQISDSGLFGGDEQEPKPEPKPESKGEPQQEQDDSNPAQENEQPAPPTDSGDTEETETPADNGDNSDSNDTGESDGESKAEPSQESEPQADDSNADAGDPTDDSQDQPGEAESEPADGADQDQGDSQPGQDDPEPQDTSGDSTGDDTGTDDSEASDANGEQPGEQDGEQDGEQPGESDASDSVNGSDAGDPVESDDSNAAAPSGPSDGDSPAEHYSDTDITDPGDPSNGDDAESQTSRPRDVKAQPTTPPPPPPRISDNDLFGGKVESHQFDVPDAMSVSEDTTERETPDGRWTLPHDNEWSYNHTPDNRCTVEYGHIVRTLKPFVSSVAGALNFRKTAPCLPVHGMFSGDLDDGSLDKLCFRERNPAVFERNEIAGMPEVAITLLVDQSGSMNEVSYTGGISNGRRYESARNVCIALYEGFKTLRGLHISVFGFSTSSKHRSDQLAMYEYLDEKHKDPSAMMRMYPGGNTPLGFAVEAAIRRTELIYPAVKQKYLFVMTDGEPACRAICNGRSDESYTGYSALNHVRSVCDWGRTRFGTECFGIGIDRKPSQSNGEEMFGKQHFICLPDVMGSIRIIAAFLAKVTAKTQ